MHVYQRQIDPRGDDSLARIARLVPPGSVVLDVGCGSGALGAYLSAHKGCTVDGLTNNPDEAAIAAQSHREVQLFDLERDELAQRYAGRRYDVVVCADVLEHLRASEAVLRALVALLAPQGRVLLSIPNVTHLGVQLSLAAGRFVPTYEGLLDATHVRFFDRHAVERLLRDAGLALRHLERVERNLAATEFAGLDFARVPPAVQRYFAAAPEATTYQFIVEAALGAQTAAQAPAEALPTRPQIETWPQFEAQVYWRGPGQQNYDEARSVKAHGRLDGSARQCLRFVLPQHAGPVEALRIDPCDRPAWLRVHGVRLVDAVEGRERNRWNFDLLPGQRSGQLDFLPASDPAGEGRDLLCQGSDPWIEWRLPATLDQAGGAVVALELDAPEPVAALAAGLQQRRLERRLEDALRSQQALESALALERHDRTQAEARWVEALAGHERERGQWASRLDAAERAAATERHDRALAEQRLSERLAVEARLTERVRSAEAALAQLQHERAEGESRLRQLQAEAAVLAHRLEQALAEGAGLERHLQDLKRSHSWRVTAPLRALGDGLRALRRRLRGVAGDDAAAPPPPALAPYGSDAERPPAEAGPAAEPQNTWAERLAWSCDALRIGHGMVVGYGWLVAPGARLSSIELLGCAADGSERWRLPVDYGRARADVAAAHPELVGAAASGWWLYRRLPPAPVDRYQLALRLEPDPAESTMQGAAAEARLDLPLPQLGPDAAPTSDAAGPVPLPAASHPVALLVDHAMGGGSARFAQQLTAELLSDAAPISVVRLSFDVPRLRYRVDLHEPGCAPRSADLPDLAALGRWLAGVRLRQLHFNGCVSYPQPLALVQGLMQALDAQPQAALVVHLHDYHVVCPSPFLLDADQRYCGVPQDLQRCRDCLGRQRDAQVGLAAGVSIDDWRARFGALLRRAAEVRCFSRSSIELLRRAYPDLDAPTLQLRPHAVAAFGARWAPPAPGMPPTLAIVGHIGLHKGAQVVAELARALERRGAHDRLRLVVIGTIDGPLPPAVRVTGAFERDDLPRLLSDEGVGFALLPSICPETFSFVVHELLALGLPLAAFDLGAQAEALRAQGERALLLDPSAGADAWLDQLLDFAARAVASQPAAAHPTPSHA